MARRTKTQEQSGGPPAAATDDPRCRALIDAGFGTREHDAPCAACAAHYGDAGRCDEGKPVASPHRAALAAKEKP